MNEFLSGEEVMAIQDQGRRSLVDVELGATSQQGFPPGLRTVKVKFVGWRVINVMIGTGPSATPQRPIINEVPPHFNP